MQQGKFEALLDEFAVESEDEVTIITERGVLSRLDTPLSSLKSGKGNTKHPRAEKIASVGKEILVSAKAYVRAKFAEAVAKAKDEIMKDDVYIKERMLERLLNEDPEVKKWITALEHIEGASLQGIENWSYVLISSPIVSLCASML